MQLARRIRGRFEPGLTSSDARNTPDSFKAPEVPKSNKGVTYALNLHSRIVTKSKTFIDNKNNSNNNNYLNNYYNYNNNYNNYNNNNNNNYNNNNNNNNYNNNN